VPIEEIEIRTLGELVDGVTPAEADPATGRRRDTGVYRGSRDAGWKLLTSLDRLGGTHPPHTKADLETHILRNFIRYSRPYLVAPAANDWELLVTAQHHGLPTRLLDWTYSPLIATHFATLGRGDPPQPSDCIVWRLDWQRVHRAFGFPPLALLIEDLETLPGSDTPLTPWAFFRRPADAEPFACMLEPPSLVPRISMQAAAFTLCTNKHIAFDDFLEEHGLGDALTRFVIPARTATLIRDQLDTVGIDERRLFADLDGVAAQLRRYYS
jgi:hypothetical protein